MNLGDGSLLSCSGKRLLSSPSGKVTVTVKYPFLPRRRSVFSCQSLLGVNYPFWSEQTNPLVGANFSLGEGRFMELYCNLHIGVSNELLWGLEGLVEKSDE